MMLLLMLALAGEPAQAQRDFTAAAEKALGGDLAGAEALYRHLLEEGLVNEDVYFNLGNVAAQSGRSVDAIVWYERALRLRPNDAAAEANLRTLRARLRPKDSPIATDVVHFSEIVAPLVGFVDPIAAAEVGLGAELLLFAVLYLRRRKLAGRGLATAASVVFALIGLVGFSIATGHEVLALERRAVVRSEARLKEGPHPRYAEKGRAYEGERVRVVGEDGEWRKIIGEGGETGWLPGNVLELL